jgi:hypothetical protein
MKALVWVLYFCYTIAADKRAIEDGVRLQIAFHVAVYMGFSLKLLIYYNNTICTVLCREHFDTDGNKTNALRFFTTRLLSC